MSGPFEGVKIVDLTTMLSGPWATSILGDQGADVIKVEVPGKGDHVRSLGNQRGSARPATPPASRARRRPIGWAPRSSASIARKSCPPSA